MKWHLVCIPILQWLVTRDDVVMVMCMRWYNVDVCSSSGSPPAPIKRCCYHSVSDLVSLDLHLPPLGWNPFSYFQKRTYLKPSSKHNVRKSEYSSYSESSAFDHFDSVDMSQDWCYLCGETGRLERERSRERHGGGGAEWRHGAVLMRSRIHL